MKTIEKILKYNLKEEEIEWLLIGWMINWCWAKNWFSFDKFMADNVEKLKVFDTKRKQELLCDLKRICYEHDLDFRFQIGFTRANYIMAKKIYRLFYWVPLIKREAIYLAIFILLMKYSKEAYLKK